MSTSHFNSTWPEQVHPLSRAPLLRYCTRQRHCRLQQTRPHFRPRQPKQKPYLNRDHSPRVSSRLHRSYGHDVTTCLSPLKTLHTTHGSEAPPSATLSQRLSTSLFSLDSTPAGGASAFNDEGGGPTFGDDSNSYERQQTRISTNDCATPASLLIGVSCFHAHGGSEAGRRKNNEHNIDEPTS